MVAFSPTKQPQGFKHIPFSYSLLFFTHKMIQGVLFSTFSLLLGFIVADSFKPTSGELILANQTYQMTWSFALPSPPCIGIAFSLADEVPPSYTTGLAVSSRKNNQGFVV
jgi:hypothetical protein